MHGIAQKHPNLAIIHFPESPAVLPLCAHGVRTIFKKPGFIKMYRTVCWVPNQLADSFLNLRDNTFFIPLRIGEEMLKCLMVTVWNCLFHIGHILPLGSK